MINDKFIERKDMDKIIEKNIDLYHERSELGIRKSGIIFSSFFNEVKNKETLWLNNTLNEALDLVNYIQYEIQKRYE